MRYVIKIAYDGTEYGGWQIQKNTVTVQQKLEEACFETFGKKTSVTASGRTDSGTNLSFRRGDYNSRRQDSRRFKREIAGGYRRYKIGAGSRKIRRKQKREKKDLLLPRLSFAPPQPFKRQIRAVDKNSRRYN